LRRVVQLLKLFPIIKADKKRKNSYPHDILRSAVVLLHASLEDLLRELLRIKASHDPNILYEHLRFPHASDPSKSVEQIRVAAPEQFRGKTIDELIDICISNHLSRRTFNSKEDIVAALGPLGLNEGDYASYYSDIEAAVKRRHKIVHESDRTAHGTSTHGTPASLTEQEVTAWVRAVSGFGKKALSKFTL
jgi:hypothetical protein